MDGRALSATAGVSLGTLNSWIGRNLVPGASLAGKGRNRIFDLNQCVFVGTMVALARLGFGAPAAAHLATHYLQRPWSRLLLVYNKPGIDLEQGMFWQFDDNYQPQPADPALVARFREDLRRTPAITGFEHETQLPAIFERIGTPPAYAVVNVEHLRETMARAEAKWQARNEAAG